MLRALQLGMLRAIAAGEVTGDDAAALGVAGDARLDAAGRLRIYAGMYGERLRAALESTYPALAKVLGEDGFAELSAAYTGAHPSRHPSLRWLGRELPGFLEGWHGELAALEWARHDVFDAADQRVLEPAAIAALGAERAGELIVSPIAAHRLVAVEHEVETVWRETTGGRPAAPPARAPGALLVWRDGVRVFHRRAGEHEAAALRAAADGPTFATLCERLAESVPLDEAPRLAGELLGRWLGDHLLSQPRGATGSGAGACRRRRAPRSSDRPRRSRRRRRRRS